MTYARTMKLSDFVVEFLSQEGIRHVFGVTGGSVVHLFDACGRSKKITPIFTHHEQAAGFAAQAYARLHGTLGAAFVTTGPGGTNAVTGVAAAWLDSIPCLYLSGQTRNTHTTKGKKIRQLGPQQLNIVDVVQSITKYAVQVDDPSRIRYHLEKAVYLAREGRPGPTWIDLPLNFQWAMVEPSKLERFDPRKEGLLSKRTLSQGDLKKCLRWIAQAKRPILLAGHGIRLAGAEQDLIDFIKQFRIPVVSTWNSKDLLPSDHPLSLGCIGMSGQRGANLAVQNCDLLLCVGSHLSIPLTGTQFDAFARDAKIIMVDIDPHELSHQTVRVDLALRCSAGEFLSAMNARPWLPSKENGDAWIRTCAGYKERYHAISRKTKSRGPFVDPYVFIELLSRHLDDDVVVVDGGGTMTQVTFQAFQVKKNQRLLIDAGLCAMGSGLPQSIGASFAKGKQRVICVCGDGSMPFNIQELQTIVHHRLPIKIFVINNDGYLAIRHTQGSFLGGRFIGSSRQGGVSLPDIRKVAAAYGIQGTRIAGHRGMAGKIARVLSIPGPAVCEIMIPADQEVFPRQGFDHIKGSLYVARPLEDMYPYLSREEFAKNMIVKPYQKTIKGK